jgi:hypothetical protein
VSIKCLQDRIDTAFHGAESSGQLQDLRVFLHALRENHVLADSSLRRPAVTFTISWFVFTAIGLGLVEEGQLATFKISKVKNLLVMGPPLLGFLSYKLLIVAAAFRHLMLASSRCYKRLLPELHSENLEYLLAPPGIIGIEQHLEHLAKSALLNKMTSLWIFLLGVVTVLVPLIAIIYVSHVLWHESGIGRPLSVASIFTGLIFWIRGSLVTLIAHQAVDDSLRG